jgi:hypothetical protein
MTVVSTLGQPGIQVFLASSGGRVRGDPGQYWAQRWVFGYSGGLHQLIGDDGGPIWQECSQVFRLWVIR